MDSEPWQQPIADKGTDDPDQEVAEDSEPGPPNDLAGQPARNDADEQDDQQTLVRQVHGYLGILVRQRAQLAWSCPSATFPHHRSSSIERACLDATFSG